MRFYDFSEIARVADCREIARELYGCHINGTGRCAALWRGGDNPEAVSIERDKAYDHVSKVGGGAIWIASHKFGGDIQAAQQWLGDRYALTPKNATRPAPSSHESRYDRLLAEGYKEVARYEYRDLAGAVRHFTIRLQHPDKPGKEFVQGHPRGGGLAWTLKGVETILYRLPEIASSDWVILCEGEKSSDTLAALGLPATTAPMGAGKWNDSYTESLRGKSVAICPDNDTPGREHAQLVARALYGVAATVRVVGPLSAREHGGVDDWLTEEHHTADELLERIAAAPEWSPAEAQPAQQGDHYDIAKKEYLVKSSEAIYIPYTESQYKRILKSREVSGTVNEGEQLSDIDRVILETQDRRCVVYSGALSGWPAGVHRIDTGRILVTQPPRIPAPVPGEFPYLAAFICSLLDEDPLQIMAFLGWLKIAYESVRSGRFRPGQALAMCGPKECGKSLCQQLVTYILGGRFARPYQYMMGATDFNSDLFTAEHLVIEDDVPSATLGDRRSFGSKIKEITANQGQRLHAKGRDAVVLPVFWRLSITVNDEPENMMIMPIIDESLSDKIILLKAVAAILPCSTETFDGRDQCWATLTAEIPALLHWLISTDIPAVWRSGRFGSREYKHPEIMEMLSDLSPETKLEQIINRVLFNTLAPTPWTGTSTALEQVLTSDHDAGYEARRLLSFSSACGVYLGRLALKRPSRYAQHRYNDSREWIIQPADNSKNPVTPVTDSKIVTGVTGFLDFIQQQREKIRGNAHVRARAYVCIESENPVTPVTPVTDDEIVPF